MKHVLLVLVLLTSACTSSPEQQLSTNQGIPDENEVPMTDCFAACISANVSLERGPCLLDPVPSNPAWVCDIAHNPRETVDNYPQNQCQSYRAGKARRFIEMTPDCQLIRVG